jgi:D-3-phosphoglycerate dehydrogenase / 2-oxoglutarate reductase
MVDGQAGMRAIFVDANPALAEVAKRLRRPDDIPLEVSVTPDVKPEDLPGLAGDAPIILIDHTALPTEIAKACTLLRHVVFLGTGARSYMNPEELAAAGITVHTIKGYGDTAVAEMTIALMWAAAKNLTHMHSGMRSGAWLRTEGMQLGGKTLGLIGFGGIAAQVARLAAGMRVLAWNRTPKSHAGVQFVDLDQLLAESHVVSLHLLLTDETRGFLSAARIAQMRRGAILVNTARGALAEEEAMIAALKSGQLGHAALDVYQEEPLPPGHPLMNLPNTTLSAHSAFRTPEAADSLIEAALNHCRRIATG